MDSVIENHFEKLELMCRICAGRLTPFGKKSKSRPCVKYSDRLYHVYGIDVLSDNKFHPKCFCATCYNRTFTHKQRGMEHIIKDEKFENVWEVKTCDSDCWVCESFKTQSKGGRPKKFRKKKENEEASNAGFESSQQDETFGQNLMATEHSTPTRPKKEFKEAQTSPFQFPDKPLDLSVSECLNKPITEPLSKFEEKIQTHLVRRKLNTSGNQKTLQCKTKGQPLYFQRVKKARKVSSEASSPLKKRRSQELSKLRSLVAGENDQTSQFSSDLKRVPIRKRERICQKAGLKRPMKATSRYGLAIKAYLGLSWTQYRKQKKLMSKFGVKFENEIVERKEQNEILRSHIDSKMIAMDATNDDGVLTKSTVPMAYVKDLPKFVTELLNNYHECGQLTWHSQHIPENEIWLKIGGDHGGGSFKLCLQVANLPRPNSKHNTVIFNIFEAKDTRKNLEIALMPYSDQIKQLNAQIWQGKRIRIFFFGDYDFLSKVFGISGAAGKFPCLWCHASKTQIKKEPESRGPIEGRTLKTLKREHQKFVDIGKGKLGHAGAYHNAIHLPLFPVHINRVCPPYLHILLGIVKKHHVMLERECHELDMLIGRYALMPTEEIPDTDFGDYVKKCREIQKLEKKERKLAQHLEKIEETTPLAHLEVEVKKVQDSLNKLWQEISKKVQEKKLKERKGPVTSNLDKVLKTHRIVPQAYHARSFVGNHCKKYLQSNVIDDLCRSITSITSKMTDHDGTILRAFWIRDVYQELNRKFSIVHQLVSHDKPIHYDEIPNIQTKIGEYMSFYRRQFPSGTVTPKMHFLEDHVCAWINTWGFGMGLHGEQGGEQVHATINLLKRRVWGVKTDQMKYQIILREHHMQVSPCVQSVLPVPRKRVKKS